MRLDLATLAVLLSVATMLPAQEVRGTWIARDGLTSRAKIVATLDALAAAHINLVCVDVWTRGYTVHPSDVLERTCGVRQDPSYIGRDPLKEMLIEAHRRGIEVEAWFEYGFCAGWSGWYPGTAGTGPVLGAHPSWVAVDVNGQSAVSDGGSGLFYWMAIEHPDVREFLLDLATEVVDRYDVDGIQFDRVRYPSTAFGYDPATVALYRAEHNGTSPPTNATQSAWKRWRADKLSAFASDLFTRIKAHRATVRVTNAPIVMNTAYDSYLQDWPAWVRNGALDLAYLQVYRTSTSAYVAALDHDLALLTPAQQAKIAPGIRAISGTSTTDVVAMVGADRARGLPGQVFWYAEELYDDLPSLASTWFQSPVGLPGRPPGWRSTPIVREDNDPSTVASAGWVTVAAAGASGGSLLLAAPSTRGDESVTFTVTPPVAGLWSVLANEPNGVLRSSAVPHTVIHAGGESTHDANQLALSQAGWQELGTFWLDPAIGPCTVTVHAVPGAEVVADAVALLSSRFDSGPMVGYGAGSAGANGVPTFGVGGRAVPGGELAIQVRLLPALAPVVLAVGGARQSVPVFGGTLLTAPLATWIFGADLQGAANATWALPFDGALHGATVQLQAFVLDAAAGGGVSTTHAVEVTAF